MSHLSHIGSIKNVSKFSNEEHPMKDELNTIKRNLYSKTWYDVLLAEISSVVIPKRVSTISDAILVRQYTKEKMSLRNKSNEYSRKYLSLKMRCSILYKYSMRITSENNHLQNPKEIHFSKINEIFKEKLISHTMIDWIEELQSTNTTKKYKNSKEKNRIYTSNSRITRRQMKHFLYPLLTYWN